MSGVLILCLIGVGVVLFLSQHISRRHQNLQKLHQGYLKGLNFLLNEEPDKAVDVFIQMLEVDKDTVETHLALGKLFRKRGEIDRAIKIHQNIISRPSLEDALRIESLIALGEDYLSAGVLDRAEQVFLEVLTLRPKSTVSLVALLSIYQQESEWERAVEIARQLSALSDKSFDSAIAHFYCEMAERELAQGQKDAAVNYIEKAFSINKRCVRATLLQAQAYSNEAMYEKAIDCLTRIKAQHPAFLHEIIKPITHCYESLGDEPGLIRFLNDCIDEHPQTPLFVLLIERLQKVQSDASVLDPVKGHILKYPSIAGLNLFLKVINKDIDEKNVAFKTIKSLVAELVANAPLYRCHQCGFQGNQLHWKCPSCKVWEAVQPVYSYQELSESVIS